MEGDIGSLDLALLDVHLVAAQHDGDVFTHALEVAVPVGYVLVRDARGDVKHDDAALALNVVAVAQAAEFLLAGSVPDVEADGAKVGVEGEGVDFDTEGGYCISFSIFLRVREGKGESVFRDPSRESCSYVEFY